jgi:hypothetical protein
MPVAHPRMLASSSEKQAEMRFPDGLSCTVLDREGYPQRLGDIVCRAPRTPALLVFLRHFGCVGCEAQIASLMPRQPELSDLGVRIVLLGNGSPAHARAFVDRWALGERPVTVVTDPTLGTFRAAGLVRSTWATFGPRALFSELLAIGAGQRPRRRDGDRFQQGGALLLDATGAVAFFHANRFVGDCVSLADVVDAAMKLHLGSREVGAESFAKRGIV